MCRFGEGEPRALESTLWPSVLGRTQEEVYAVLAEAAVGDFLRGINATIFAYGQTGTGKTYSMYGSEQVLHNLSGAP